MSVGDEESIVDQLTSYIRKNEYRVGDKLPSTLELAEMFHCSSSQVRTALMHLATLGMIEIRPRSGSYVKEIDSELIVDLFSHFLNQATSTKTFSLLYIYELKTILDTEIFSKAADIRTTAELFELRQLLKEQEKYLDDTEAFVRSDEAFHEYVASITRNPLLKIMMNILHGMLRGDRIANSKREARMEIIKDHTELFDHIKNRDKEGVKALAHKHSNRRTMSLYDSI